MVQVSAFILVHAHKHTRTCIRMHACDETYILAECAPRYAMWLNTCMCFERDIYIYIYTEVIVHTCINVRDAMHEMYAHEHA